MLSTVRHFLHQKRSLRISWGSNRLTSADTASEFTTYLTVQMGPGLELMDHLWLLPRASPNAHLFAPRESEHGAWSRWENGQEWHSEFSSKMLHFDLFPKQHPSSAKDRHEVRQMQLPVASFILQRHINLVVLAAWREWDVWEVRGAQK